MSRKFVPAVMCLAFVAQAVNTSSVSGAGSRKKNNSNFSTSSIFSKKTFDKIKKYISIFSSIVLGYKALTLLEDSFEKYQNKENFFSEKDFPKDIDPSVVELITRPGSPFSLQKENKAGVISVAKFVSDLKSKYSEGKKAGINMSPKDFCGNGGYDAKYLEALKKLPINYLTKSGIFGDNSNIFNSFLRDAVSVETNRLFCKKQENVMEEGKMGKEDYARTKDTFLKGISVPAKEGFVVVGKTASSALSNWSRDRGMYLFPAMAIDFLTKMYEEHVQEEKQQQKNKGRQQQ